LDPRLAQHMPPLVLTQSVYDQSGPEGLHFNKPTPSMRRPV
jgi:hypothetical protein